MYEKKLKGLTLTEKNSYIIWQIDKINTNIDLANYICIDFNN